MPRPYRNKSFNRFESRNTVQWAEGVRSRLQRPPGLKGKEIGLYYKNLKGKKKEFRELTMKLNVPKSVVNRVRVLLQVIAKTDEGCQSRVEYTKSEEYRKLIKVQSNNSQTSATYISDNKPNKSEIDDDSILFKTPDPNVIETETIKNENKLSIDNTRYDFQSDHSEPNALLNDLVSVNRFAQYYDSVKESSLQPENIFPGPSSTPDFIPIKDVKIDYDSTEQLFSLRGNGNNQFKYDYYDIITGSFQEKLDKCLADGVAIKNCNKEVENLNAKYLDEFADMSSKAKYKKMLDFRKKLPTYEMANDLLEIVERNQVVVISGETGCGKSTQVPQILLDDAICKKKGANFKILVTQPRRIAASSLAQRVAEERAEQIGNSVGYMVRLEKVEARCRGSIMFCTTGILLADLEVNQGLTSYSHIVLDEVHERDSNVDLAMCMLKQVINKRKDLKLILMSATLDADRLCAYFNDCPRMHIEGLAYPVKDIFLEEILMMTGYTLPPLQPPKYMKKKKQRHGMQKEIMYRADVGPWLESIKHNLNHNCYKTLLDYRIENLNIDLIVELLKYICRGEPGAILVFLPGISDITKLIKMMEESKIFPSTRYEIHAVHSKLPSLQQNKIFVRPPPGIRKIIVATNIAETSITIDDIVYVVDCAKIKVSGLNVENNIATLQTEWVAQANLRQRRGRAGRCQSGICYHLLTTFRVQKLPERLLPELQRSNLLEAVLVVKKLRLGKAVDALNTVPDPPALSTIEAATKHLKLCGALDTTETLTPLGWHLARLPAHPAAGKLLVLGALFGCLDRAASVAAVWGFKDPFMLVIGKEQQVEEAKRNLTLGEPSDHVAISEAIISWENLREGRHSFAYEYFLSIHTLELLSDMKKQFGDNLKQMGFLPSADIKSKWENRNANNLSLFKAIIAASLYPNIGSVRWAGTNPRKTNKVLRVLVRTPEDGKVQLHPSSVMATPRNKQGKQNKLLCTPGANWLVYWFKQKSTQLFLIDVTLVYTMPLLFFGVLKFEDVEDSPTDCYISFSNIKIRCDKETANLLIELRFLLDKVLATKQTPIYAYTARVAYKPAGQATRTWNAQTVRGLRKLAYSDQGCRCRAATDVDFI
ncbi:ATP-dependent RNA helicase DHX36 [Eumeta japonica]|uniref:RNA helicase n=1 Tax=Eumeta variegata TaxID=151549 RepID=A0A4C1YPF6_EUMVA|nr:ATP-dependent RNA helicase DHX36 [Eumeta japonica]